MKKCVFITGVLGEIGSALAKTFKKEGFYIYGVDPKEDFAGIADRSFRFDLNTFVEEAEYRIRFTDIFNEIIPHLDVLVNTSTFGIPRSLEEIKLDEWQKTLNANLTGPLLLCKFFQKRLEARKGTVINIGGNIPQVGESGDIRFYTVKSALSGFTEAMAHDLKGRIRVNSILPFLSENIDSMNAHKAEELPVAVANMAVFLASEKAANVSGSNFSVNLGKYAK